MTDHKTQFVCAVVIEIEPFIVWQVNNGNGKSNRYTRQAINERQLSKENMMEQL